MRVLYELLCLRDPSRSVGLGAGEPIHIVPISRTVKHAQRVVFSGLEKKLALSPWFKGRYKSTMDYIEFPDKKIMIVGGAASDSNALGLNVFASILDELNFMGVSREADKGNSASGQTQDRAQMIYDALVRRVKSRYQRSGVKGMIFLLSSKRATDDFTERRIRDHIKNKSTAGVFVRDYCLAGDTRVLLVDGSKPTIAELADEYPDQEKTFWLYSVNEKGQIVTGEGFSPRITKQKAPVVEITLDNKNKIKLTDDHRVMLADGNYRPAGELVPGDLLFGLSYETPIVEKVKVAGKCDVYDLSVKKHHNFGLAAGIVVHNCTWTVQPQSFANQKWYRCSVSASEGRCRILDDNESDPDGALIFTFPEDYLSEFQRDPSGCFTGDTKISLLDGREVAIKDLVGVDEFWTYSFTPEGYFKPGRGHSARLVKQNASIVEVELDNGERIRCTPDHPFMLRDGTYLPALALTTDVALMSRDSDRSVKSIVLTGDYEDVYDITVDITHNFALTCGVVVKNSARDIAGIASDAYSPFISKREAIEDIFDPERPHLFDIREWEMGRALNIQWNKVMTENARGERVPWCCPHANRHVHIDLSKNQCATGFCLGHQGGMIEVVRVNPANGEKSVEEVPVFHIDGMLRILAGPAGDVDHSEVRSLIYKLNEGGFNIRSVSMDHWMSVPNMQIFKKRGYRVEEISTVKKIDPYDTMRAAIYENRIQSPEYDILRQELRVLELDPKARPERPKVRVPPGRTKDISDAFAACIFFLAKNATGGMLLTPTHGDTISGKPRAIVWSDGDPMWSDEEGYDTLPDPSSDNSTDPSGQAWII